MGYSSLPARLLESKAEIRRNTSPDNPDAARAEWFAGLAVSPPAFSRQLSDMQTAMQRANGAALEGRARAAKAR